MRSIKRIAEILERNVEEARKYIECAYMDVEYDKPLATWERDMALAHLKFNDTGHTIAAKAIQEQSTAHANDERVAGMKAVWEDRHGKLMTQTAEIQFMVEKWK